MCTNLKSVPLLCSLLAFVVNLFALRVSAASKLIAVASIHVASSPVPNQFLRQVSSMTPARTRTTRSCRRPTMQATSWTSTPTPSVRRFDATCCEVLTRPATTAPGRATTCASPARPSDGSSFWRVVGTASRPKLVANAGCKCETL